MNKTSPVTIGIMVLIGLWILSSTVQNVATAPKGGVQPAEKEKPGLFKRAFRFVLRGVVHSAADEAIDGMFEGKPGPHGYQSNFAPIYKPSEFLAVEGDELNHGEGW